MLLVDMNNFHYVAVLLDQLYGLELEDQDLEELGLLAWEHIGNKTVKLYRYTTEIDPRDNSITLPCNALEDKGSVELVTTNYEDWERVTNYSDFGNNNTSFIEQNIEAEKMYDGPYYMSGKVLKYEQVGDKLYFTHNYGTVNVLYKGKLTDDEGLPELSDKEAIAIATYIAYVQKYKEGLKTNNTVTINLANSLLQLWNKQCDQARVQKLSQNDMDQILEVKASFDRKSYGKGYKILK